MGVTCFHCRTSQAPKCIPDEIMVRTIGLILLSGYFSNLRISSIVGALSFAACLPFGNPLVIFFHGMSISALSQNTFNDFTKFFKVADVISAFSTLSFWNCRNRIIWFNFQLMLIFPLSAKWLHLISTSLISISNWINQRMFLAFFHNTFVLVLTW